MKTHPLNLASLLFGLVFVGIAAGWLLYELDIVAAADLMWLIPLVLIGAGIVGIALSATRSLRSRSVGETTYQEADEDPGPPWHDGHTSEPAHTRTQEPRDD